MTHQAQTSARVHALELSLAMMAAKYLGLFYFSVLVAILAAVTADSTGRRKIPTRDGGHLSQIMMEEYLEDQNREVAEEPKVENASPLQLCILLMSTPFIIV